MVKILNLLLLLLPTRFATTDPSPSLSYNYRNVKDELYEQPVTLMASKELPFEKNNDDLYTPPPNLNTMKTPHAKDELSEEAESDANLDAWSSFDFSKIDEYLNDNKQELDSQSHNRIKRRARRRNRGGKRRNQARRGTTTAPEDELIKNITTTDVPIARGGEPEATRRRKKGKGKNKNYETYESPSKNYESSFVEMPKDLYQAHLRPGVIFRIHMSEAILKMQYRNYGEDKDESVIEADVEYLRLTRKVINDEITKFEDLQWLNSWFLNRSQLIQDHMCNTRYLAVGTPPTMFTHPEEYMKRLCLFDGIYIDHIPYVVGEDMSLMAAVAPPVLHCDAATCTSVPFIDSVMFDEKFSRTNVRTLTRCQASCRAHCRNDPDCLKRCSDRCLRAD